MINIRTVPIFKITCTHKLIIITVTFYQTRYEPHYKNSNIYQTRDVLKLKKNKIIIGRAILLCGSIFSFSYFDNLKKFKSLKMYKSNNS